MKRRAVSNSKDLLEFYPFLEDQKGWAKFATAFDKPECKEKRRNAARACRRPVTSRKVKDMRTLCSWIRHGELLSCMPNLNGDGQQVDLSPVGVTRRRLQDACSLASAVEMILSDSEGGRILRQAIEDEIAALRFQPDTRSIYDACIALFRFISREERLPTKKELNREVNRMKKCNVVHVMEKRPQFGDTIKRLVPTLNEGRMIETEMQYRVYEYEKNHGVDDNWNEVYWFECRLVRDYEWGNPYWADTSDVWKPGGLSGLPKAGKSQLGDS